MISYWLDSDQIKNNVLIPKYYNPHIVTELEALSSTHDIFSIQELVDDEIVSWGTGHEIGKMAYGTGDIPFVRTSDISNWEVKTLPKQGVSQEIYDKYARKQDIQVGDILIVRDGTYLIGTNCVISEMDKRSLYQSHVIKLRVNKNALFDAYLFFIAFNSTIVKKQIRSLQFTADTIDTIGNRFLELMVPIPKSKIKRTTASNRALKALEDREKGKAFIKELPTIMEKILDSGSIDPVDEFYKKSWTELLSDLSQNTITSEFGEFETFWLESNKISNNILLPKYYDPMVELELEKLSMNNDIVSIRDLIQVNEIEYSTGDEIGKMAYGTGSIPFIRTSDFSNWEIKHDPKQGVSEEIYLNYSEKQDVKAGDIFLVRDGTYLIGTSSIVTEEDKKCLYCGGLLKFRVLEGTRLDPYLLLGILNSFIVKRQIRTKQFTRDVIDTLGKRIEEVFLPIPKSPKLRQSMSEKIEAVVRERINGRKTISYLSEYILTVPD